jgi:hypothetical protein
MTDRKSGMVQAYGYPTTPSNQIVSRAVAAAAANSHHSGRGKSRNSKRYSVSAFYSMAAEQDNEVEDELAQGVLYLIVFRPFLFINFFICSTTKSQRIKVENICTIKKELCTGERCKIS